MTGTRTILITRKTISTNYRHGVRRKHGGSFKKSNSRNPSTAPHPNKQLHHETAKIPKTLLKIYQNWTRQYPTKNLQTHYFTTGAEQTIWAYNLNIIQEIIGIHIPTY